MSWRVELTRAARRQLDDLDGTTRQRIAGALFRLAKDPRGSANVKALAGTPLYRLRVGDDRVVYALEDDALLVLVVGVAHRREAYR